MSGTASSPALYFRATDPSKVHEYLRARELPEAIFYNRREAFLKSFGAKRARHRFGPDGLQQVIGFLVQPPGAALPEGWRYESPSADIAVPDDRTEKGKALIDWAMSGLQLSATGLPQAPVYITHDGVPLWGRLHPFGSEMFLLYRTTELELPETLEEAYWGPLWEPVTEAEYRATAKAHYFGVAS